MMTINEVITELLNIGTKPKDIAQQLGVSEALISTWKNKENDFVPRLKVARDIWDSYGYITYPYAQEALEM